MSSSGRSVGREHLPRNVVDLYNKYSFEAFDNRGAWAYDTPRGWFQAILHSNEVLEPVIDALRGQDTALAEAELENLEKAQVCWRDKGFGSLVQTEDLEVSNPSQAVALSSELGKIGTRLLQYAKRLDVKQLIAIYDGAAIPINKGKGAPYWIPGTNTAAAVLFARMYATAKSLADIDELVLAAGSADAPMCATTYMRIQASRKMQEMWHLSGDSLVSQGERRGPKIRKIQALPFIYNYALAGMTEVIKYCMTNSNDEHTGKIEPATESYQTYPYHIAADLSNYDDSVGIETLDLFREVIFAPFSQFLVRVGVMSAVQRRIFLEVDEWLQKIKLLTPPLRMSEGARLVRTVGGIKSGEKPTSLKGTLINEARIKAKAKALGLKIQSYNQGDDTLVYSNQRQLRDLWFENQLFGFNETEGADLSFLMKRIPTGYSYLTRMVLSNINRESAHEAAGLYSAASAMRIRYELLKGHPAQDRYWDAIIDDGRLRETKLLAANLSVNDLLFGMVSEKQNNEGKEDTVAFIEDGLELGLISRTTAMTLRNKLATAQGRSIMTLGEMSKAAAQLTLADANVGIKAMIYRGRYRRNR
jgi:hypothetical protein